MPQVWLLLITQAAVGHLDVPRRPLARITLIFPAFHAEAAYPRLEKAVLSFFAAERAPNQFVTTAFDRHRQLPRKEGLQQLRFLIPQRPNPQLFFQRIPPPVILAPQSKIAGGDGTPPVLELPLAHHRPPPTHANQDVVQFWLAVRSEGIDQGFRHHSNSYP